MEEDGSSLAQQAEEVKVRLTAEKRAVEEKLDRVKSEAETRYKKVVETAEGLRHKNRELERHLENAEARLEAAELDARRDATPSGTAWWPRWSGCARSLHRRPPSSRRCSIRKAQLVARVESLQFELASQEQAPRRGSRRSGPASARPSASFKRK